MKMTGCTRNRAIAVIEELEQAHLVYFPEVDVNSESDVLAEVDVDSQTDVFAEVDDDSQADLLAEVEVDPQADR